MLLAWHCRSFFSAAGSELSMRLWPLRSGARLPVTLLAFFLAPHIPKLLVRGNCFNQVSDLRASSRFGSIFYFPDSCICLVDPNASARSAARA